MAYTHLHQARWLAALLLAVALIAAVHGVLG